MLAYIRYLYSLYKSNNYQIKSFEIIRDKWWVQFNDSGEFIKWRFEKKGVLTISNDGNILYGSWRILDGVPEIIITYQNENTLFKQNFLQDNILLLVKDSKIESWYAFYDEDSFSPKEISLYLKKKEEENEIERIQRNNIKELKLLDGREIEVYCGQYDSYAARIGNMVMLKGNDALLNGEFITTNHQILKLQDGKISNIHYIGLYRLDNSIDITIKRQKYTEVSAEDEIINAESNITQGLHMLNSNMGISVKGNKIDCVYKVKKALTFKGSSLNLWFKSANNSRPVYVFQNNKPIQDGVYFLTTLKIIFIKDGKTARTFF
ncbi:hypothetical protein [Gelidibacter japonicus]|uniref:hypothetical protein n=1 Tax=Gelidibacter japonicus TaxID=1962232 RepID=UPI003A93FC3A